MFVENLLSNRLVVVIGGGFHVLVVKIEKDTEFLFNKKMFNY